jgi:hypothetical protein
VSFLDGAEAAGFLRTGLPVFDEPGALLAALQA